MIVKPSFISFALAIVAASCAEACLDKYVETVATGREGVQQKCFVHANLLDAIRRYKGESIVHELYADLAKGRKSLWKEMKKFSLEPCDNFIRCEEFGRFNDRELTGRPIADAQCFVWSKFERLRELVKGKNSVDRRILAVEQWVCQVSEEQRASIMKNYYCPDAVREAAEQQADRDFYNIFSFNEEDLEKAKQELNEKLAVEKELKAKHEAEIAAEVHQLIRERVAKHFADYQTCWKNIEAEEERKAQKAKAKVNEEAEIQAIQAEDAKKKKGFLGKLYAYGGLITPLMG